MFVFPVKEKKEVKMAITKWPSQNSNVKTAFFASSRIGAQEGICMNYMLPKMYSKNQAGPSFNPNISEHRPVQTELLLNKY